MTTMNTTSDRFSMFKNAMDSRIDIIQDNTTGFYRITRTTTMVEDFFQDDMTKNIIDQIKLEFNINQVDYKLNDDVSGEYAGTYVHKYLYHYFRMWLSTRYNMKIMDTINNIQDNANP